MFLSSGFVTSKIMPISHNLEKGLIAIVALGAGGELGLYILPFVLGALVEQHQQSEWVVSLIVSLQFTCIAIASLYVSFSLPRLNLKTILAVTVSLMIAGNLMSVAADSIPVMVFGRGLTGLGEGGTLACAYALGSRTLNPDRTFSMIMFFATLFSLFFLVTIPYVVEGIGVSGIFIVMLTIAVCLLPLIAGITPELSAPSNIGAELTIRDFAALRGKGLALFSGLVLISMGSESSWIFIERIGQNLDLDLRAISHYAIIALAIGCLGPAIMFLLGNRLGRTMPIIIAIVVMAIAILIQTHPENAFQYVGSLSVTSLLILFLFPFVRATMSQLDPSGQLAASSAAAFYLGSSLGPALSGQALLWTGAEGYGAIGWFALFVLGLALLMIIPVTRFLDHENR